MVSQTSHYALRAVLYLATTGGGPAVAHDISETTGVPKGYLHKILRRLSRAKILDAQRGVGGGYALVREPKLITVLEVLLAINPKQDTEESVQRGGASDLSSLKRLFDSAQSHLDSLFASTSIQDLVDDENQFLLTQSIE